MPGYELRGGAPARPPERGFTPRGGIVRKKAKAADGSGRTVDGVQFASVVVYPRANFNAAKDIVRLARSLSLTITPVGNPVYRDGTFARTGDGKAERSADAIPAYHDAYRLDGPDGATARVCAHPAARSWGYVTNVAPPRGGMGAGTFTPASEKREKDARREGRYLAHDRRVEAAHLAAGWGDDWLLNPVDPVREALNTPVAPGPFPTWDMACRAGMKFDSLCPAPVNPADAE